MKMVLFLSSILLVHVVSANQYKCKEHSYTLELKESGFEHINHHVILNGNTVVKELEKGMWFIEDVKCSSDGFKITASHIQYNDPTKKVFLLKVRSNTDYLLD